MALVTIWLWTWTFYAFNQDLPRHFYMLQKLVMSRGQTLQLLSDIYLWSMFAALTVAVISWRVRRLRSAGMAGLVVVPAILLMSLYVHMGLTPGQVDLVRKSLRS